MIFPNKIDNVLMIVNVQIAWGGDELVHSWGFNDDIAFIVDEPKVIVVKRRLNNKFIF